MPELYYSTVEPLLKQILTDLMQSNEFKEFRLVGGTALSLHRGHRKSIDIDLFTSAPYGSIDFDSIDKFLNDKYQYVETSQNNIIGFGKSYFLGINEIESIKLDVYYTDPFIDEALVVDGIRLATVAEIIAMKLDVISRGGRKKDFWDIHELSNDYTAEAMFELHKKRHQYTHDKQLLKDNFTKFDNADQDFDPDCFHGKHWQIIKLDLTDFIIEI